jgi:aspartate carbamoyltransferase catalytic subunit
MTPTVAPTTSSTRPAPDGAASSVVPGSPLGAASPNLRGRDLLDLETLTAEEIAYILDTAESFGEIMDRPIKKVPTLRGKSVCTLFYEASTRTRSSFELAAKIMSADVTSIAASTSSVVKGESLKDTILTLDAMRMDLFVIRHSMSGAPAMAARYTDAPVVNAGDGMHEHPTQGLLDLFTMRQVKGRIEGLTVAIVGDIAHSRVARSNIWGLTKLGATVRLCGPATLLPAEAEALGARVVPDLDTALEGADVVNVLRLQLERQERGLLPTIREYAQTFGVSAPRLRRAKEDVLVMHPGPINRGVEITGEVADAGYTVITDQVRNGVIVRMALLYLLMGGG